LAALPSSTQSGGSNEGEGSSSSGGGLSGGQIAGIVVGSVLGGLLVSRAKRIADLTGHVNLIRFPTFYSPRRQLVFCSGYSCSVVSCRSVDMVAANTETSEPVHNSVTTSLIPTTSGHQPRTTLPCSAPLQIRARARSMVHR